MILEIPVFTVEAALQAASFGAHRLELCSGFSEGGLTPGAGALKFIKSKVTVPVFVMIRPRGGDFVYTSEEIAVMQEEIRILKSLGADGFVFGVLTPDGNTDQENCRKLVETAEGLPCTFHRAFDFTTDLFQAMEDVIQCGFQRILTSGGKNSVGEGLKTIQQLLEKGAERMTVMPGGGMKPEWVKPLAESGHLREIHASCKTRRPSRSTVQNTGVALSESGGNKALGEILTVDQQRVEQFLGVIA